MTGVSTAHTLPAGGGAQFKVPTLFFLAQLRDTMVQSTKFKESGVKCKYNH